MFDFLDACREPVKRTHLIYRLQINHYQFQSYARMLLKFGMIEEIHKPVAGFLITTKGRTLLEIFNYSSHQKNVKNLLEKVDK